MENIVTTLGGLIGFAIGIGLYVLLVKMAKKRGRSGIGWLILSFVISAPAALLVLSIMGNKKSDFYTNTNDKNL